MTLQELYDRLYSRYGPQHWWPAETPFEVIIGAILTQNTNWLNVEKAIDNLRAADALDPVALLRLTTAELEALIRPSGFFRQKALRLQTFITFLQNNFRGDLQRLFSLDLPELRTTLLAQNGIGPETADSIVLYAAQKPSFVVDAYTHRILARIGIQSGRQEYDKTRDLFMTELPHDSALFNEFHALLVRLAKEFCRKSGPACTDCPVVDGCRCGQSSVRD